MQYRKEIDGLRALAVIPVVLFHAGFSWVSGGFIGVDVFFVISGYLITKILLENMGREGFSLVDFYEKRARRILPALFFVVIVFCPFAWLYMGPAQMKDFSQSLSGVSLFSSNFVFWMESGYFDVESEFKPFLHTWSLGVEEQFYFLFPLLFLLEWGRRKAIFIFIFIFVFSVFLLFFIDSSEFKFFLLPARSWELVTGSFCAWLQLKRGFKGSEFFSWFGVILLLISFLLFDSTMPFPSIYTFIPVIGVVLIIVYGIAGTQVAWVFGRSAFVKVGLLSYSIYLWHQPIFSFYRIITGEDRLSFQVIVFLFLIIIILAYFTWRFVETPIRKRNFFKSGRALFISLGFVIFFIFSFGVVGHVSNGFDSRFDSELIEILKSEMDKSPLRKYCHYSSGYREIDERQCMTGGGKEKRILLWGDSHADSLGYQLISSLEEQPVQIVQQTYSGCPPILGIKNFLARSDYRCYEHNSLVYSYIKENNVDIVVLSARWPLYINGTYFDNKEGGVESNLSVNYDLYNRDSYPDLSRRYRISEAYESAIRTYLDDGLTVILVYPIPEAGWNVPRKVTQHYISTGKLGVVSTSYNVFLDRINSVDTVFSSIKNDRLYVIKPSYFLCNNIIVGRCINSTETEMMYTDDDHLSHIGTEEIASEISKIILSISN